MDDAGLGVGGVSKSVSEMTTSKLDYWSPFLIEKGVSKSYKTEIRPQSISSGDGPTEFHISPDPEKFLDIQSLTLHGRVGVEKKVDGKWISVSGTPSSALDWGVINNIYQSLFSSVTVKLNDYEIGDLASYSYPYNAYLQTLLSSPASKSGINILKTRGFIKDAIYHMSKPSLASNSACFDRTLPFATRALHDFCINLHNDVFNVEKYLPPGTKISITLRRSDDDFLIWKDAKNTSDYRFIVQDLHIKVRLLEVYPDVLKHHLKMVKEVGACKIKYTRNTIKSFAVPKGSVEMKSHNLFFGSKLPNRVYLAFVEQDNYNGTPYSNPFNFEVANCKEASLLVNGISEPSVPYTLEKGVTQKELYYDFMENCGTSPYEFDSVDVSYDEYFNGYFVLCFDRSPTKDNGLYSHKSDGGSLTVRVKCSAPLEKNMMVLCFASYDSNLIIVEDKVITDAVI